MNVKIIHILILKTAVFPDGSVFCLRNGGFYHIEAKRCRPTVYVFLACILTVQVLPNGLSRITESLSGNAEEALSQPETGFPVTRNGLFRNPSAAKTHYGKRFPAFQDG